MVDMSTASGAERLKHLREKGHPLMTLIYIDGHVMLYVGEKKLPADNRLQAITYQNLWGIASLNQDKRYVVGQSVFFPLVKDYIDLPDGSPQINKPTFKLIYLDALKTNDDSLQIYAKNAFDEKNAH